MQTACLCFTGRQQRSGNEPQWERLEPQTMYGLGAARLCAGTAGMGRLAVELYRPSGMAAFQFGHLEPVG